MAPAPFTRLWSQPRPDPPAVQPRAVGVDDFPLSRGHVYGTVVIDAETHRMLDVPPDREATTPAPRLARYLGIEIVCRDRSGAHASTCRRCSVSPSLSASGAGIHRGPGSALVSCERGGPGGYKSRPGLPRLSPRRGVVKERTQCARKRAKSVIATRKRIRTGRRKLTSCSPKTIPAETLGLGSRGIRQSPFTPLRRLCKIESGGDFRLPLWRSFVRSKFAVISVSSGIMTALVMPGAMAMATENPSAAPATVLAVDEQGNPALRQDLTSEQLAAFTAAPVAQSELVSSEEAGLSGAEETKPGIRAATLYRRAEFKRGSALMWTKDTVYFGYNGSKVTSSKGWQASGHIFPNIAQNKGMSRYQAAASTHKWRAKNTIGAGVPTPWGSVNVYSHDYTHYFSGSKNGAWSWKG